MKWIYYSSLSGFSDPMEIGENETGFDAADEFIYSEQGDYSFFVKKYEYEGKLYNQYDLVISKQGSEIFTATCSEFGDVIERSQQFFNNINKINKTNTVSPILLIKFPYLMEEEEIEFMMEYMQKDLAGTQWRCIFVKGDVKEIEFQSIGAEDIKEMKNEIKR